MSDEERQEREPEAVAGEEVPGTAEPAPDASEVSVEEPVGPSQDEVQAADAAVLGESRQRTRRSFAVGAVAAAAGYGVWRWIDGSAEIGRQPVPLRRTFQADAAIARDVFHERGLAPTYPLARSRDLRLNGNVGMEKSLVPESWRLQLVGVAGAEQRPGYVADVTAWTYQYTGAMQPDQQAQDVKSAPGNGPKPKSTTGAPPLGASGAPKDQQAKDAGSGAGGAKQEAGAGAGSGEATVTIEQRFQRMAQGESKKRRQGDGEAGPSASSLDIGTPGLLLTMAELQGLPKVEFVTEFKCIEGWSEIVHWGGYRLRDLIEAYPPERVKAREPRYVYMETPDGSYYGGYDMSAARHPQSLLVTEMAGKPLTEEHGAPLRLHMPIKYGYKQLKRIGLIAYMDTKPDDYWTKLGYDWYAGL